MPLEKMVCGDNYTTELLKDNVNGLIDEVDAKVKARKIVVLGASIMNGAFSAVTDVVQLMNKDGIGGIEFSEFATSGYTTSDVLSGLPAILANYTGQDDVLFMMHIGGNNVTNTRPYSTATNAELRTITSDINQIITDIEAAGHTLFMANISFRSYSANEENGSLPYNRALIEPIIKSRLPQSWDFNNDKPMFDMYTWFKENQDYITDGVHLTDAGYIALREQWLTWIKPLVSTKRDFYYPASGEKIVVNIGGNTSTTGIVDVGDGGAQLETVNGVKGGYISFNGAAGFSETGGRGNAGDTSMSLTNNDLLTSYAFKQTGTIYVNLSDIAPKASGTLAITASRASTADDKTGYYEVDGVIKQLNALSNPPDIITFDFEINENGSTSIRSKADVEGGSQYTYFSGIELTFN